MEKKLTKAELKALEERQEELRRERRQFIEDIESFWRDQSAAERYLKIKGEKLSDEEREELLHQYESLKDLKVKYNDGDEDERIWCLIREMVNGYKSAWKSSDPDKYLTIKLDKDDLLLSDNYSIWDFTQLKMTIRVAKRYGYKNIFFMSNSTQAAPILGQAIAVGGKVVGSTYNVEYERFGIIVNIEEADVEYSLIEDEVVVNDIRKQLEALGDEVKYEMYRRDIRAKILLKYTKTFGLGKVYDTYSKIAGELIEKYTQPKEED